ncbi:hypothetical protein BM221_004004 [Beauveria bassiana]|uniref:DUF202 domain-containing protein n=1 Tax=Beauveria bassiana TaxID=176275 RepID=A0A2N6NQ19_BEABA|nr:hypothetical protein BM221_004004 [Beauveria bassiana]
MSSNEAASPAPDAAPESGTIPATPSNTTRGRLRQRRQSKSERISEILENARGRADEMGTDPAIIRRHSSFGRKTQFADDEADETTGIVSRGSSHNYQAVNPQEGVDAATAPPASGTRSIYSLRSRTAAAAPSAASEGDDEETRTGGEDREKPWWKQQLGKYQSIELENKGSVARDHLALVLSLTVTAERTFLAWLRTSLAFASIGIAVTQLFRLNTSLGDGQNTPDRTKDTLRRLGRPLGATFLGISILILLLGFKRYFHSQEWILKGKFPASRGTIVLVSLVGLAIMVASLVVVVVIHPTEGL